MTRTFFRRRSARLCHAVALVLGAGLSGCSDTTTPAASTPEGAAEFDGRVDPAASSFVLQRLETTLPDRAPVPVDLIGSNVRIDPTSESVSIQVAVRNLGDQPLHVPATIWLHRFVPPAVSPSNADFERGRDEGGQDSTGALRVTAWGFDYSELLGDDGVLTPGETSENRAWEFHDPGLMSFAFAAQASFGMQPDRPQISGLVFQDDNRNGRRDRGEVPFNGVLLLATPGNQKTRAHTGPRGRYSFPIEVAGLYRVMYESVLHPPVPCPPGRDPCPRPGVHWCVTTANPLEVLILEQPDGQPSSFKHADFGAVYGLCDRGPWLLVMTERQPDDIAQDAYDLLGAELVGDILELRVGVSGCSPDHPFVLYAGRGFMESNPVQTWALLAHDDLNEPCDGYFERALQFDLSPLRAEHIRAYGRPGVVIVRLRDSHGNEKRFEFGP